jgi:hypothetical protein
MLEKEIIKEINGYIQTLTLEYNLDYNIALDPDKNSRNIYTAKNEKEGWIITLSNSLNKIWTNKENGLDYFPLNLIRTKVGRKILMSKVDTLKISNRRRLK